MIKTDEGKKNALQQYTITYPKYHIIFLAILGAFTLALGIVLAILQNKLFSIELPYSNCLGSQCKIDFSILQDLEGPIFVYYSLYSYYQNYQFYTQSLSSQQLQGESDYDSSKCFPFITNKEMGRNVSVNGTPLDPDEVAIPCGLIAHEFITDTFKLFNSIGASVPISVDGIIWDEDKGIYVNTNLTLQWMNLENEHFINWMRLGITGTVVKLYGRIEQPLQKGDYTFNIEDVHNGSATRKSIILRGQGLFAKESFLVLIVFGVCILVFTALIAALLATKNCQIVKQYGL